jgi:hypothetical protein
MNVPTLETHWRTVILILFLGSGLWGEAWAADRMVQALRTEEAIVLDGVLDEEPWLLAEPAVDFIQAEPSQGEPSTQWTEVRILFDLENLYFGIVCFDDDPSGIVANSLRRDFNSSDEDTFEILLDTFASSRNGFLFVTNPNGAKRDVQVTNEGRELNESWDAIWEVKARINEQGWMAEVRIPISSLRYRPGNEGAWKVNFGRRIRRGNEIAYWSEIPRRYNITQVSLAGTLSGLSKDEIHPGRNLSLTPYVIGNLVERGGDQGSDFDFGADLKYGITPGLTLDLTYNTDFSHVEVDQQQVNLDRFRLSFPEKRDFFLENQGLFEIGSVRLQRGTPDVEDPAVFYSRNIGLSPDRRTVPIVGGARLTGRMGAYELGLLNIQTEETESQGPENNSVLRIKRDVLARSWIGGFFLNRQGPDRLDNRVYGIDGLYRPHEDLIVNSFFARSQNPGIQGDDWVLRVEGQYDSRWLLLIGTHADIQENYRSDLGFTTRTGVRAQRLEMRPRIRPWEGKAIREIQPVFNVRYVTDVDNRLVTRKQSIGIDFYFQNGAFLRLRRRNYFERLDEDFSIRSAVLIPVGDYNYEEQGFEFNTDRSRALSASLKWYQGEFWNGDKTSFLVGGQYRPDFHISAGFDFTRDSVRLPGGDFRVDLLRFRLRYAFNTRTFLDTFIQYNSEEESVTSNVRFNLIHHSLSDLFLVYTEERPTSGENQTDRVISVKYTHLLGF